MRAVHSADAPPPQSRIPVQSRLLLTPPLLPDLCLLSSAEYAFNYLDDLHAFDPATMTWTLLSSVDDTGRPSARAGHGFTSAGGLLYVHGGYGGSGETDEGILKGFEKPCQWRLGGDSMQAAVAA